MPVSKLRDTRFANSGLERDPKLFEVGNRDPGNMKLVQPITRRSQCEHNTSYFGIAATSAQPSRSYRSGEASVNTFLREKKRRLEDVARRPREPSLAACS